MLSAVPLMDRLLPCFRCLFPLWHFKHRPVRQLRGMGLPVLANAIHASLTLSASTIASAPPPLDWRITGRSRKRKAIHYCAAILTSRPVPAFPRRNNTIHRPVFKRGTTFRHFHRWCIIVIITGYQEKDTGSHSIGIDPAIQFDNIR